MIRTAPIRASSTDPPRDTTMTSRSTRLVIDVRSEAEHATTALVGAVNVPLPQLAARIAEFAPDPSTPIVLHCASGGRSAMGCQMLRGLGYTDVADAGGLIAAAGRLGLPIR